MDAKVSTKTKTKTFQNLNKNCPSVMLWVTGLNFEFTLYGSTYWDLKSNLKEKKK